MAGGIFVGSVYATMELQTGGFAGDIARAQTQLASFEKSTIAASSGTANWAKQANGHFNSIADGISGLVKTFSLFAITGSIGIGAFVKTAAGLETTNKQMAAIIGSGEKANKIFGELYSYTLGKPIAFPDASKAATTLLGYGISADSVIDHMKTLSKLSIINGADLQLLSNAYGQVNARGKLYAQDALQLINNKIPITTTIAKKLGVSIEEVSDLMSDGKISAQVFNEALRDLVPDSALAGMTNTFNNRMISMQGSLRSFGNTILGLKIDPIKGLVVESGGLFDVISQGVANVGPKLKALAPQIKAVIGVLIDNGKTVIALLAALGGAFATAKLGAFITSLLGVGVQFLVTTGAIEGATAAQWGFNAAATANPVGAIVAAIVALGAALVFLQVRFGVFTKLFKTLKPIIDPIVGVIKEFWGEVTRLAGLLKKELAPAFEFISRNAKIFKVIGIGLLVAVFWPLVQSVLTVVIAMKGLSAAIRFVSDNFESLKKVVLFIAKYMTPIGLLFTGLTTIMEKFGISWGDVMKTIKDAATSVKDKIVDDFNRIKAVVVTVRDAFIDAKNKVSDALKFITNDNITARQKIVAIWDALRDLMVSAFTRAWEAVKTAVTGKINDIKTSIVNGFTSAWESARDATKSKMSEIKDAVQGRVDQIKGKMGELKDSAKSAFEKWKDDTNTALEPWRKDFMGTLLKTLVDARKGLDNYRNETIAGWKQQFSDMKQSASDGWKGIKESFSEAWRTIKTEASDGWNTFKGYFSWEGIKKSVSDGWAGVKQSFKDAWASIKLEASTSWNAFKANFSWEGIKTAVDNGWESVKTSFNTAWASLKQSVKDGITSVKESLKNIFAPDDTGKQKTDAETGVNNFVDNTKNKMMSIENIRKVGDAIIALIGAALIAAGIYLVDASWRAGQAVVGGLANGIRSAGGWITGAISDASAGIGRFFGGIGNWLWDAGRSLISGFTNGIKSAASWPVDAVKSMLEKVKNFFPHSPAKEGPFSGRGWTPYSGAALMQGFAEGVTSQADAMRKTMFTASDNISGAFNPSASGAIDYSRIGTNGNSFANANGPSVQMYGNINIATDADGDRFLTNAGLMREGQLVEKGMSS